MADITDNQFLATDPEVLGLQRQRKLAEMLMAQGMQQPQGQMISGYYVPPSGLQQALPMINAAIGGLTNANLDTKQTELANALRGKQVEVAQQYAQAKTPQERMAAAMSPYAPKAIQTAYAERLKGQKVGEGEKIFFEDGGTIEGAPKYHAPIQIDTGTSIELRDPLDPTKVISRMPKSQMPTAGQVVETANGPMLVNTRTGAAQPIHADHPSAPCPFPTAEPPQPRRALYRTRRCRRPEGRCRGWAEPVHRNHARRRVPCCRTMRIGSRRARATRMAMHSRSARPTSRPGPHSIRGRVR